MATSGTVEFYKSLIGQTLNNNYRIEKIIGSGGMGAVFLATHLTLGSSVAVKVLSPALTSDQSLVKRFQREARVGGQLTHPNIVRVQDFGKTPDGLLFMVMEYVAGETLAARLSRVEKLSLEECLRILEPLCDALGLAHGRNLLHRDLKPANVLVGELDGRQIVKLLDFGIVKLLQPDEQVSQLTAVGQVFGTPLYMAPEHLMGLTLSPQADLYSLAVMAYEMLTGQPPAQHDDLRKMLELKMKPPPSVATYAPALPSALDAVFAKALASNPEQRYGTASEFFLAMQAAHKQKTQEMLSAAFAGQSAASSGDETGPPSAGKGWLGGLWNKVFGKR
ncbi:MAG: serine/threonine-protein kinase [Chloracidobacterium sp.]|nr:serine/threonine-protein kinase [Chloracidobacterium validum]